MVKQVRFLDLAEEAARKGSEHEHEEDDHSSAEDSMRRHLRQNYTSILNAAYW